MLIGSLGNCKIYQLVSLDFLVLIMYVIIVFYIYYCYYFIIQALNYELNTLNLSNYTKIRSSYHSNRDLLN